MFNFNALAFYSMLLTWDIAATQDENLPDEMDSLPMTRFLLALVETGFRANL